jgi:hypothetical protein
MNHPMPARDRCHRSPDPGGPSRSAKAVPRTSGLVGGVAAVPSQAEGWPLLAHILLTRVLPAKAWRGGQYREWGRSGEKRGRKQIGYRSSTKGQVQNERKLKHY